MKKLFTLFLVIAVSAISAMAEDYTDNLSITVYSKTTNQEATITAEEQTNGKYKFALNNFAFGDEQVGDIVIEDVDATEKEDGIVTLTIDKKTVKVTNPGKLGKKINSGGGVELTMNAKISKAAKKMYAVLDMTAKLLFIPVTIKATFGDEKNITTGISNLPVNNDNEKEEIFNLQGQRISEAKPGQVVIVKKGGKAVKVVK
ncbi:MAG: calycin-like domain-containing protein [Prevotella sp.]|nr:calycin-like domain-containing protein [Prevotella sp.]